MSFAWSKDIKVEIDPDNPCFATDGYALYSKDFSTLIAFFDVMAHEYKVDERTNLIKSRAFDKHSLIEINFLSSEITLEDNAFSFEDCFEQEDDRCLETIRFYGHIKAMGNQSSFNKWCKFLEVYLQAMSREECEEKGLLDTFPDGSIIYFKDGTSFSKTYIGGVRYDFDYEKNEATACTLQRYYENPYICILPEVNGMPVTRIQNYFTSLDCWDEVRSSYYHERIIIIPNSIKVIEKNAFSYSRFTRCTIAAFDFTYREWITRFGDLELDSNTQILNSDDFVEEEYWLQEEEYYQLWFSPYYCDKKLLNRETFRYSDGVLLSDYGRILVFYPCCKKQKTYEIPVGVETIDDFAFYGNEYLETLVLPNSLFGLPYSHHLRNLKEFVVQEDNPHFTTIDGVLFNKDCSELIAYPGGKQDTIYRIPKSVRSIDEDAFPKESILEQIVIPSEIESLPFSIWELKRIEGIDIVAGNSKWITLDGVLFSADCMQLLKYPTGKPDSNYVIPDSVLRVAENAFVDCKNLKYVTCSRCLEDIPYKSELHRIDIEYIEKEKNSAYSVIDDVIFSKDKKRLIKYPYRKEDKIYTIPEEVQEIDKRAFFECAEQISLFFSHADINRKFEWIDNIHYRKELNESVIKE